MPFRILRPRTRRGWVLTTVVGIAVALVVGFGAAYLTLFRGSSLAPLALSRSTASPGASLAASQVPGAWTVGSGSIVGYRVRETLFSIGSPSDAVGRTSSITGTMTLTGSPAALTVSAASFSADVSTLTSDQSMRDDHVRSQWLDSNSFPKATFTLDSPIALPATAVSGASFAAQATGKLTIHGVTKTVTMPISARLSGGGIELVGSTSFPFEQFGMSVPSVDGFVSVVDHATLEFDLHLTHS